MSEHSDYALNHASGHWVTILGDDDGLLPYAVGDFFSLIAKHPEIKAVVAVNCSFRWPSRNAAKPDSKLCYVGGTGYEIRGSMESLERTLKGEIVHLPSIYTGGFVHMDVIREIRRVSPNGTVFLSISPDIYSAVAICSVTDKYILSRRPWSVTGSSHHSNGRQHRDIPKAQAKQLPMHCETQLHFHPSLGDGCVEAMQLAIYECVLQSAHLRKAELGVSLFEQLVICLIQAGRRTIEPVTEYCRAVAIMNAVDFDAVLQHARRRKLCYRLQKLGKKIARILPSATRIQRRVIRNARPDTIADAVTTLARETQYSSLMQ
jgi:hypothetical protein